MLIEIASPSSIVSPASIAAFQRDGFVVLERVTTVEDLANISRIMARLYRRYRTLAREKRAWDLGIGADGAPEILEINQTIALEAELEATPTFQACRALAARLLGRAVEYRFDHAIYKPAFNGRATAWHQDEAYTLDPRLVTAHFWVPMQDVSVEMRTLIVPEGGELPPEEELEAMEAAEQTPPEPQPQEELDLDALDAAAAAQDAQLIESGELQPSRQDVEGAWPPRPAWPGASARSTRVRR